MEGFTWDRKIGQMKAQDPDYKEPFAKHIAESQWQSCMCKTCQHKRWKLDSLPGKQIDYATFRLKDERY